MTEMATRKDLSTPLMDADQLGPANMGGPHRQDDIYAEWDALQTDFDRVRQESVRTARKAQNVRSRRPPKKTEEADVDIDDLAPREALLASLQACDRPELVDISMRFYDTLVGHGLESDAQELVASITNRFRQTMAAKTRFRGRADTTTQLDFSSGVTSVMAKGLKKFLEKLQKNQPQMPQYEIRIRDLGYRVTTPKGQGNIVTIGSAVKSFVTCSFRHEEQKWILRGIDGVLKPGSLTLVLGPPGCGKSTLLKALAGRLKTDQKHVQTGVIEYNGQPTNYFPVKSVSQYVQQTEVHLPQLTVRETFDFAKNCLLHKPLTDDPQIIKAMDLKTDIIMYILGLTHTADTVVGNAVLRGVSGGERRRVTLGELIMGNACCFFLDQISTGLDSAATFDIVQALKTFCEVYGATITISLLQPPPEVFDLFDDVMIMDKGQLIYNGPREAILPYFGSIGYHCPPRKDLADFLQEVSHPIGQQYVKEAAGIDVPRTTDQFVQAFKRTQQYQKTNDQLQTKPEFLPLTPLEKHLAENNFALPTREAMRLCLRRQAMITLRNVPFIRARIIQNIIMGILVGTLFFDLEESDSGLRYGLCFFSCLFLAMGNLATVPEQMAQRNVFYKQRSAEFFPTSAYAVAVTLLQIPFTLVECSIYSTLVYFLTNMTRSEGGSHFIVFYFIIAILALSMSSYFRLLAVSCPDMSTAQPIAGFSIILFMVFAGYLVTKDNIPGYWIWAYYLSPLKWALVALLVNEFRSPDYDEKVEGSSKTIGETYLEQYDFPTGTEHIAYGFIVLLCYYALFTLLAVAALQYLRVDTTVSAAAKEVDEHEAEKQAAKGHRQVNLPFTPAVLSFHNLSYSVPMPGEKMQKLLLLNNVSGYAKPGTITALMGSSGAGKTTLLDVIAGRKTGGKIDGKVLINGHPKDDRVFGRFSGYVEQMDIHSPMATVREALLFSARLRLAEDIPDADKVAFVDEVLGLLELQPLADSIIGTKETGGLSVEAAKRVTIGVELVANPSVLFLDEPTSGLDSRAAQLVMRAVKNIAKTGRSILCTIHQPSVEIFELFDNLLLLKRGGEVVYFGPLGLNSCHLIKYFESIPGTRKCESGENPATYMLESIGAGVGNVIDKDFAIEWRNSVQAMEREEEMEEMENPQLSLPLIQFDSPFATGARTQFRELLKKWSLSYWRSPNYNLLRMVMDCVIALLFGSVYFDLQYDSISGTVSRVGAIYVTTVFAGVLNLVTVLPVMAQERAAYYRERAANTYGALPYAVASGLVEFPYLVATSLMFVVIFYYMVGFRADGSGFLFYWLVFGLYVSMKTFFGQFLAVWAPSLEVAQIIGPAFVSVWNLFCGFMIPEPNIPTFWKFLYWLAPPHYVLAAISMDQFYCEYESIEVCRQPMAPPDYIPPHEGECECVTYLVHDMPVSMTSYDFVKEYYGWDYDDRWKMVIVLIVFVTVFRCLTLFGLRFVSHLKR